MTDFLVEELLTGVGSRPNVAPFSKTTQSICYFGPGCTEEVALIRLLLGNVSITFPATGEQYRQGINYSVLGRPPCSFTTKLELEAGLIGRGIDPEELDTHLRSNFRQIKFQADLCGELLHFFLRENRGQHTLAFIHLYRLLERISFPLPLLYAARTKDFKEAYEDLKAYFEGKDKGELGFFEKFCSSALDPSILDTNSVLSFSGCDTNYQKRFFTLAKRLARPDSIVSETPNIDITLKNRALISFFIVLRNRFFHGASQHPANISATEMPDSDQFFSAFTQAFINWLAVIYFEILEHSLTT